MVSCDDREGLNAGMCLQLDADREADERAGAAVQCHTSHLTRHTSHVTRHSVTPHTSHVTCSAGWWGQIPPPLGYWRHPPTLC
jgi:hypothetical protein